MAGIPSDRTKSAADINFSCVSVYNNSGEHSLCICYPCLGHLSYASICSVRRSCLYLRIITNIMVMFQRDVINDVAGALWGLGVWRIATA